HAVTNAAASAPGTSRPASFQLIQPNPECPAALWVMSMAEGWLKYRGRGRWRDGRAPTTIARGEWVGGGGRPSKPLQQDPRRKPMMRLRLPALAALGVIVVAMAASAQDKFPVKPVKIVVPYAPGGATDIVARIVAEQMRQSLGQAFVVENKPGAFGIVAL